MIDRQKQHGDFKPNAELVQELKWAIRKHYQPYTPPPVKEALDNICQKIGRIVTGQYDYTDHWKDIQGYSERILELIEKGDLLESDKGRIPNNERIIGEFCANVTDPKSGIKSYKKQ